MNAVQASQSLSLSLFNEVNIVATKKGPLQQQQQQQQRQQGNENLQSWFVFYILYYSVNKQIVSVSYNNDIFHNWSKTKEFMQRATETNSILQLLKLMSWLFHILLAKQTTTTTTKKL